MGGADSRKLLLLLSAIAAVAIIGGCSREGGEIEKGSGETAKAVVDFEASCRLNGFSWITKQPQERGIVLADKPCLGCTVDSGNHFCIGSGEDGYNRLTAALADFRSVCKANGDVWMLMEPAQNNIALSEKMCWGCMADEGNHICSKEDYLKFESET
ncbi:hypothetical protein HYU20_01995 [Candidatus Woesearchaeota archaeon]|nr:hypothetical protein [Candidatus Woesearchaeota archaeon]